MAFVVGTVGLFRVAFVVAMTMESKFVTQFLSASFTFWSDVIDLYEVFVFEVQSTPAAFSLLLVQEFGFYPVKEGMRL